MARESASGSKTARIAAFLPQAGLLDSGLPGVAVHGAHVGTGTRLRALAADPQWGGLDVFLPVQELHDRERLAAIAQRVLPPARRGIGALAFYPHQSAPDLLRDGQERVLVCVDPQDLPAARFSRDRFAAAATPIVTLTHGLGHQSAHEALFRLAGAPPAPDSLFCLSRALRDAVETLYETFPGGPYPVPFALDRIPNGVDGAAFQPASSGRRAALRRRFGLPADAVVGMYFGRVTAHGKADLVPVLTAFEQIDPAGDELLWIVGGEFPQGYRDALAAEAGRRGLGDRVRFQSGVPVDQRADPYGAADFLVFPSDTVQEAHPNVVGEALASGLPVVLSDWDGMRDWIDDGVEGFLVPTWIAPTPERIEAGSPWTSLPLQYLLHAGCVSVDVAALADRLRRLYRDPALRRRLAQAARRRAETMTWEASFAAGDAVFRRLLDAARAEPDAAATARRAWCERIGIPGKYTPVFDRYATHRLDEPGRWRVRLSAFGVRVRSGTARLSFQDDLNAVLRPEIVVALTRRLDDAGEIGKTVTAVVEDVALKEAVRSDDVLFHLSLLLKQGLLVVEDSALPP